MMSKVSRSRTEIVAMSSQLIPIEPLTMKLPEIRHLLQISPRSVWRYVNRGWLPRPFKTGRDALWDRQAVMAAIEDMKS